MAALNDAHGASTENRFTPDACHTILLNLRLNIKNRHLQMAMRAWHNGTWNSMPLDAARSADLVTT
jgi:hypothetical protein